MVNQSVMDLESGATSITILSFSKDFHVMDEKVHLKGEGDDGEQLIGKEFNQTIQPFSSEQ